MKGMLDMMMSYVTSYSMLFLFISFVIVDQGMSVLDHMIEERIEEYDREELVNEKRARSFHQMTRGRKLTNYVHKGYDFHGAAGQDILVTDSIRKRLEMAITEQFTKTPFLRSTSNLSNS